MTPPPKLQFPPAEIVVDTREQVTLYSTTTGEEYEGDRTGFVYTQHSNGEQFAHDPKNKDVAYICQSRGAYTFPPEYKLHREMLICGDYGLKGYEKECAPDRKKLSDFVFTITVSHDRFLRTIERARANGIKLCVVVEGTLEDILTEKYITPMHRLRLQFAKKKSVHVNAILGAMYRLNDLGVPVHLCGTRERANDFTLGLLLQKWSDMRDAWRAQQEF